LSFRYGLLYLEFSRAAKSLKEAIISAISDVRKSGIGAQVLRVDECDLVTPSEIARRIGRSRQLVQQYICGKRGPGGFPPPECHLTDHAPLWASWAVSYWLVQNNLLRPEVGWNAEVVEAINSFLDRERQRRRHPKLLEEIQQGLRVVIDADKSDLFDVLAHVAYALPTGSCEAMSCCNPYSSSCNVPASTSSPSSMSSPSTRTFTFSAGTTMISPNFLHSCRRLIEPNPR
jgi:hypothetical protein